MNTIFIDELRLDARVGIYPREIALSQSILLNLEIGIPDVAAERDDIHATVNYERVIHRLREALETRRFNLLETLAGFVASLILEEFPARSVRVSVTKPGIVREAKRIGVVVVREKLEKP